MEHDVRGLDGIRPECMRSEEMQRDRAGRPAEPQEPRDHVDLGETPLIVVDEVLLAAERRRRRRRRRRRLAGLRQAARAASAVPGCWPAALAEEAPP